jgi:hypothetical protein
MNPDLQPFAFLKDVPIIDPRVFSHLREKLMREQLAYERDLKAYAESYKKKEEGQEKEKGKKMQSLRDFGEMDSFCLRDMQDALEEYEDALTLTDDEREDRNELREFLRSNSDIDEDTCLYRDYEIGIDYAQDYAYGCCTQFDVNDWPFCHIDWDDAAEALRADMYSVDVDGEEFLYN